MIRYSAEAISRVEIMEYAQQIRNVLGVEDMLMFPVCSLLESLPEIFEECVIEIVEDCYMEANCHATTDVINRVIRIKESVYDGAANGNGRDRMTIMHEFSHYLFLVVNDCKLTETEDKIVAFKDPEWQAKALAAELMIPYSLTKNMSFKSIAKNCGVSIESAKYQKKKHSLIMTEKEGDESF